jgi:hypothetical protein
MAARYLEASDRMHNVLRCALLAAVVWAGGCRESDESPRLPLDHPPLGENASAMLVGDARAALDSGNRLYSAKAYAAALEQYRRAAALAPEHDAPLFGIVMVANATADSALADSAATAMREHQAAKRPAADLLDVHKGVLPDSHPPIAPGRDTVLRTGNR